jgi:CheY-like chemotaxis protein
MARGSALIVDDSSTARIILARLLERADIATQGVASAEDALKRLQTEQFDLIFLDHLLPGMDGFRALETLKTQPETRHIPVFMYTSQNAEKYLQDAKARGAAGVISKQIDRNKLLQIIEVILTGHTDSVEHDSSVSDKVNLASINSQSQTRRITGRLSTLEIAYEETHEELRQLKQTLMEVEAYDLKNLELSHRRLKRLWFFTLIIFTLAIFGLLLQVNWLSGIIESVSGQVSIMREMLGNLIELVGK